MSNAPSPGSQRGAIRPPSRGEGVAARPVGPPVRRPGSMDGVVKVAKPEEALAPVVEAPANAYAYAPGLDVVAPKPKAPEAPVATAAPVAEEKAAPEVSEKELKREKRKEIRALKRSARNNAPEGAMGSAKRFDHKKFFLIALAVIVLLLTAYVAYDTWLTNSKAEAVLTNTNTSTNPSDWKKEDEGQDESSLPSNALDSYVVEASMPRALYIDKLDVAARVMPMSINKDGSIQAPKNIYDSGWYNGSVKPGETGAMFIDAHASGPTRQGLFAYLDTLKVGDKLQIEKGNGEKLNYKVVHTETVPLADVDMRKVLLPHGNTSKAMNLMTCTGKWLPLEKTYDKRVIVYTEQV